MNASLSQEDFELIERLLNGELRPDQLDEIQERMASDQNFASQIDEIRDLRLGIERAALAVRLDSYHSEIGDPDKEVPVRPLRPSWLWGVAASFFLVASAGVWWIMGQKSPEEQLYQAYFRPDPGLVTSMASQGNYEFDRAMVDYKDGKYSEAIDRWEKLLNENPKNDTLNYFFGAALLASDQESLSLDYFQSVAENSRSAFYPDANWYAGLAALKLGQKEKALNFLRASSRPEAQKLISELESK